MTLSTIDIEVPPDRLPAKPGGRETKVPVEAKLLPSAAPIRFLEGDQMDVNVSEEIGAELEIGDVIAVPPVHGDPQPVEVIGEPGTSGPDPDLWVRVKPARDKKTLSHELADANARDAEMKRRMQRAEGRRTEQTLEKLERGREMLREAGFSNLAEGLYWATDAASGLYKDMDAIAAADEVEPAAT